MAIQAASALDEFSAFLEAHWLRGLWAREERYWREPTPFGLPYLWKWTTIAEGLEAARRLVPTNFKGACRAITLVHPSLPAGAAHTIGMAVQFVKAGEAVYAHRHTPAAIRFVLHGNEHVYTITDGEKCVMERGDLLVQPNWGWHNHLNESNADAVWIDCLDSGLANLLRTMFQEPYLSEQVQVYHSPIDSAVRHPGGLAPPGGNAIQLAYKWRDTLPALENMLEADKSPFDGRCVDYRDAGTGGPTLPIFSCWIQMLEPGATPACPRRTSVHLCHAFEGAGVTEAGDETLPWEQGHFLLIPNWTWHSHCNTSPTRPALLFSTTDRPHLEAEGLYREEAR